MVLRRIEEHQAKLLSSNSIYDMLIEDDDVFEKILKLFDFSFIYDEVKGFYCDDNGRPPYDPIRLYKASLVQRLKRLSDPEMEYAARYDIRIKHFIGIPIQDCGFDYSTLSRFRTRLGEELFEKIFQKILLQIVKLGVIKNPKQQYLDSMPVLARAALPSVTCLIYQSIKNVVNSLDNDLKKTVCDKVSVTEDKLSFYSKPRPLFRMEDSEKKAAFEKAVDIAREIVFLLESKGYNSEELTLLRQIISENVNENNEQIQTEKPIKTLADKDARLGHKTKEDLIFGYKNHASVTEEGIITAVKVTSAAETDSKQTKTIISKQEEVNLKAEKLDADSAYGFIETFKVAKGKEVELNAPLRGLDEKEISVYELTYNKEQNSLTCPNGYCVIGKGLRFTFPIRECRKFCPKKDTCPLPPSKIIELHKDHDIAREAIARQRQRSVEKHIAKEQGIKLKSRLIIENVFAYLEKLGGKQTAYFGFGKTSCHVLLVATISNIMKTVRLLG